MSRATKMIVAFVIVIFMHIWLILKLRYVEIELYLILRNY